MSLEPPIWPKPGPAIGWVCSYTPEEIIMAAGAQPVRLAGSGEPVRQADAYLHANLCPYVRSVLDQFLERAYDLDGIVLVNSCDAMRRLYDVLQRYVRPGFSFILDMPRSSSPASLTYYATQLRELLTGLGEAFSTSPVEGDVCEAIGVVNHTRTLFRTLYTYRRSNPPAVSGVDSLRLAMAATRSPKPVFNSWLEARLAEGITPPTKTSKKPRLMLSGSIIDQLEIISLVEESGHVVVEDLCTGHRYVNGLVDAAGDPFEALARRYLQRAPCSRMIGLSERLDYLKGLVESYQVRGIIYHALKFCDQFQYDYPHLKREMNDIDLPILYLEGDYTSGGFGQMKTRVQAFVEMLREMA